MKWKRRSYQNFLELVLIPEFSSVIFLSLKYLNWSSSSRSICSSLLLVLLLHHLLLSWSALHWWLRHTALHIHLTALLVVHSVSSWLIRIILLIHVLILVVITSTLIGITTSASVISLTSSSILVLLCSVIVVPVLLLSTLVIVWSPHLIHWVVISVILSKQWKKVMSMIF